MVTIMKNGNTKIDFIGVGVQKSATTWIFNNLLDHPEICGPEMKETGFFMNKYSSPFVAGKRKITDFAEKRNIEDYEKLYSHCENKIKGEFTPCYLYYEETLPLIKKYNPDVKIILCIRNPIDRAFSHYLNEFYRLNLKVTFSEATKIDDEILKKGLYSKQIQRLFSLFNKNQIFICFYDDIFKDPVLFIQKIYSFLGVNSKYNPVLVNSFLNIRKDGLKSWARFLHMKITPILRKVGLGGFIKKSPRLRNLFNKIAKKKDPKKNLSNEERSWLLNYYKEDLEKLSSILDKDFSNWK
jgi:hypothetical protein